VSVSAAPLSAGAIRIEIGIDPRDGATRRARLVSSRPTGFSARLFAGRPAQEVPALVARMHALCGRSHMVAAEMAIVAAIGRDWEAVRAERFEGLVAERLGEHLRSTVTVEAGRGAPLDREHLADVRSVLAGCRLLTGGRDPQRGFEAVKAIETIGVAMARLGLAIDRKGRLATGRGSWAEAALAEVGPATGDRFADCDRLTAADDEAVVTALARDPAGFSAAPRLPGRRPETGPAARAASGMASADGRTRLAARFAEIAEAASLLAAPPADPAEIGASWGHAARVEHLTGYAAVESPRGRLHHLVRIDETGRVAAWAILAPTEWNFHAEGPLVATLMLNRFPFTREGWDRATRIAASYDPCVGFEVAIEEMPDA
jgi:Ni,Fe-hydrogenase III large subunit